MGSNVVASMSCLLNLIHLWIWQSIDVYLPPMGFCVIICAETLLDEQKGPTPLENPPTRVLLSHGKRDKVGYHSGAVEAIFKPHIPVMVS